MLPSHFGFFLGADVDTTKQTTVVFRRNLRENAFTTTSRGEQWRSTGGSSSLEPEG
jgi:hypothetical protein